ncbi:hypothetical protein [Novosphingobium huizhouense]|uniref:hypothetical protein n=1 Tax=Novosphingobium huizhouense TaxID=2866625 RepID=UPI001CD8B3B8|nr:hypothetical protein [Novosphingobium huizhouense]
MGLGVDLAWGLLMGRQMPIAHQRQRRAALLALQTQRALAPAESDELASLEHRAYMRDWRALQRAKAYARRRPAL